MTNLPAPNPDLMAPSTPQPVVSWTVPATQGVATTIPLWTPTGIGWAAVLLGFPGAAVLAALNWHRMGDTRKGLVHLAGAVIALWALILLPVPPIGLGVG